jgi:hypothetical protein
LSSSEGEIKKNLLSFLKQFLFQTFPLIAVENSKNKTRRGANMTDCDCWGWVQDGLRLRKQAKAARDAGGKPDGWGDGVKIEIYAA